MNGYWLSEEAQEWETAIPIGNGRIGASVWGKIENERITINEESMWYGGKRSHKNKDAHRYVGKVRELLLKNQVEDAEFLCQMSMTGTPKYVRPYQMACDLNFLFSNHHKPVEHYRRELDLGRAVTTVTYTMDETRYCREYFVSMRKQLIVMRLTAKGKNQLKFQFNINRRPFELHSGGNGNDMIYLKGQCGDGVHYYGAAMLGYHDGKAIQLGDYLAVTGAHEAVIYFNFETDFGQEDPEKICISRLREAKRDGYERIYDWHQEDYKKVYGTMSFQLESQDYSEIPMDQLLSRYREEDVRRYLTQVLFAFGRYLLIGASWNCRLPANLQGIWCGSFTPKWESKYTININLEMNYWMVDSCGLSECFQPFMNLLEKMVENGKSTAREIYGCHGSVAHHNTDCYGDTDLEGLPPSAYMWPMGEAWLSLHLYDHYLYSLDETFLKEKVLPVLEQTIRFYYDFMEKEADEYWLTGPSLSPENTYETDDGQKASITMCPTMDIQILTEVCKDYMDGCRCLKMNGEVFDMASEILEHLPPVLFTADGRIREWYKDYKETELGHRHISHLFGLYPGNSIHQKTPEYLEAAAKTLEFRQQHGGGHTGWSRAWLICMYARLWNREKIDENIQLFFEKSIKCNLFDSHPPFQIDGNFGFCAGIVETLVQKIDQDVYLLPAIPKNWKKGNVEGIGAKGGIRMNMEWDENRVQVSLISLKEQTLCVHWCDQQQERLWKRNEECTIYFNR